MSTTIAEIVVPELFTPYMQQMTESKSSLIRSGALVRDKGFDALLAGGGYKFTAAVSDTTPDDYEGDNVGSDEVELVGLPYPVSYPEKALADPAKEIKVRLSRNGSWSVSDLASDLGGSKPMHAIATRVSDYWMRRMQDAFIATMTGVFAQNARETDAMHFQNDMTHDVSSVSYSDGVTNFGAGAFVDTLETIGDQMQSLSTVMVHSKVFTRMLKRNLIHFAWVQVGSRKVPYPTILGREVIVDDSMPFAGGVFECWLFGRGAVRLGMGVPKVPTEVNRAPATGNGAGQEVLHSRVELIIHPEGHAYVGNAPKGGPTNDATLNNLAHVDSWKRAISDRDRIRIARLITREF